MDINARAQDFSNFVMLKKCLIFLLPVFALADRPCLDSDPITGLYKEVGCTPIFENESKCATSYSCRHFHTRERGVCRYHNVSYEIGQEITNKDVLNGCGAQHCKCIDAHGGGEPEFSCANLECGWSAYQSGCIPIYEEKQCCSSKVYCEDKDPERSKCTYEGKTYVEGQVIYPDDEPCKKCFCKSGGQVQCEDISCDVELHAMSDINKFCVPIYYGTKSCCPIGWKCPSMDYKIRKADSGRQVVTTNQCWFGEMVLDQYDIVEDENEKDLLCQCSVPPYVTCIKLPPKNPQF